MEKTQPSIYDILEPEFGEAAERIAPRINSRKHAERLAMQMKVGRELGMWKAKDIKKPAAYVLAILRKNPGVPTSGLLPWFLDWEVTKGFQERPKAPPVWKEPDAPLLSRHEEGFRKLPQEQRDSYLVKAKAWLDAPARKKVSQWMNTETAAEIVAITIYAKETALCL